MARDYSGERDCRGAVGTIVAKGTVGAQVAGCVMKEVAGVDEGKDQGGQGSERSKGL